jgi:hypothetical protein
VCLSGWGREVFSRFDVRRHEKRWAWFRTRHYDYAGFTLLPRCSPKNKIWVYTVSGERIFLTQRSALDGPTAIPDPTPNATIRLKALPLVLRPTVDFKALDPTMRKAHTPAHLTRTWPSRQPQPVPQPLDSTPHSPHSPHRPPPPCLKPPKSA